jgi:hypothetical protein
MDDSDDFEPTAWVNNGRHQSQVSAVPPAEFKEVYYQLTEAAKRAVS